MKTRFTLLISTLIVATVGSVSHAAGLTLDSRAAEAERVQILHYEPLSSFQIPHIPAKSEDPTRSASDGSPVTVTIAALGKSFELMLKSNDRLYSELPRAQKKRLRAKARLFRGQIAGMPGSWVRLAQVGQDLSGMIWDGTEAYLIDPHSDVSPSLRQRSRTKTDGIVIYRLADVMWNDARCALDPNETPVTDYRALVQELQTLTQPLAAASRELRVAVVADTQFVQSHSADAEAAVVAQTNVVDGIYTEQLGVHLKIAEIRALQTDGALTSTEASTLLSQFKSYVGSPGFTNPGLAHLFTGRTMNSGVLGVAYIAALCSASTGIGVSHVSGSGSLGALTVAHEMGHNFGAYHDNQQGSPCASTAGTYIMNPYLNGSDQFSQCSLSSIQPVMNKAGCIVPISGTPTADIRVNLPTNPITAPVGTDFPYRIEVTNGGSIAATNSSATISIPNSLIVQGIGALTNGSCASTTGQVSCSLGDLGAGDTRTIALTLVGGTAGQYSSQISVAANNDSNAANNTATEAMTIGGGGSTGGFEAHFDSGTDGFVYVDDSFRNTTQPGYASGVRSSTQGFSGGGLVVQLGAIDDNDILKMSGGWGRSFTLATAQRVLVTFRIQAEQTPYYERDELSQAMFSIDGRVLGAGGRDYLLQITGDGDGGSAIRKGWLTVTGDLGVFAAGTHKIVIGGFNNKKTDRNEGTYVRIDDVVLTTQ
jgi:Metallo-peptidase family M12/Domain of unknown function DUF11